VEAHLLGDSVGIAEAVVVATPDDLSGRNVRLGRFVCHARTLRVQTHNQ
jgi:hypothetical protein